MDLDVVAGVSEQTRSGQSADGAADHEHT